MFKYSKITNVLSFFKSQPECNSKRNHSNSQKQTRGKFENSSNL